MIQEVTGKQRRLANPKHEAVARNLAKGKALKEAYKTVYKCSDNSTDRIYTLLQEYPEIAERQTTLLDLQGLSRAEANNKLKDIMEKPTRQVLTKDGDKVDLEDKSLQLETCKTVLKMHGVLDNKAPLIDNRQVNINNTSNIQIDSPVLENTLSKLAVFNSDMFSPQDGEIEQPEVIDLPVEAQD